MKSCKQCRRLLDDSLFRPTKSRSTGLRKSVTGSSTICRSCESMNVRAHNLVKLADAGCSVDPDKLAELKQHYQMLLDAGCPLVTKAAQRLMGVVAQDSQDPAIDLNVLYEHIAKLRKRQYPDFDTAEARHKQLEPALRAAGLYAEANDIVDGWFLEE